MKVRIQHKPEGIGQVWGEIPCPELLSEQIALMKSLIGTKTLIKIENDRMICYLCGTENIRDEQQKRMGEKSLTRICQDLATAHQMLERSPLTLVYVLQLFSTEAEAKKLFPEAPPEYLEWKQEQMSFEEKTDEV